MSSVRGLSGKGAQKREQLLDTAEELLVTTGSGELSMRAVAAAAGVRLGHLQHYFPTHAELVAAVLERVLARSVERLAPLLDPGRDEDALLRELLAEQQDMRLVRLFAELWALAARDPSVAAAVRAFYDRYQELVACFLAERRPALTEEERRSRARVFVMLIEGASLFRSGLAGTADAAADAELLRTAGALLGP
ncbi:TetR/AcrR family transcriptional regulator [Kitasatospora sp. MY 5-36]|uniref:TetR/AcrR family transcriptional regulator n=1 Tax=unclassified Kitasatospora TaxID=2633591 RepID=UPI0006717481|nr:TetR/AcrR family transcriptional regulator [Kitasatospora sp. MY 5-36]